MKTKKLSVLIMLIAIGGTLTIGMTGNALAQFAPTPLPGGLVCPPQGQGTGFDDDVGTSLPENAVSNLPGTDDSNVEVFIEVTNPSGNPPHTNGGTAWLVDSNNAIVGQAQPLVADSFANPTRTFVALFNNVPDGVYQAVFCMLFGQRFDPGTGMALHPVNALGNKISVVQLFTLDNHEPVVTCGPDPLIINIDATQLPVTQTFNPALVAFLTTTPTAIDAVEGNIALITNNAPVNFQPGNTVVRFSASDSGNNGNDPGFADCTVQLNVAPVAGCQNLPGGLTSEQLCLDINAATPFCGLTVSPANLNLQTVAAGDITPNFIYNIHNSGAGVNAHARYVGSFTGFTDALGAVIIDANHLRFINSGVDTPFANMFEYPTTTIFPVPPANKILYRSIAPGDTEPVGNKLEVISNSNTFSGNLAGTVTVTQDLCGESVIRPTLGQAGDVP